MEKSCEIIQKSEVILEAANLEVTDKVKTIKSLMDAVVDDLSFVKSTNDVLDYFNRFLNGDFAYVINLLNQNYPLFEFQIINSLIEAKASEINNCISVPNFVTNLELNECKNLTSLEGLPDGLKSLTIEGCDGLTSLEGLPDGLRSLKVDSSFGLTSLKGLPSGLKNFEIDKYSRKNLDEESLKMLEEFGV